MPMHRTLHPIYCNNVHVHDVRIDAEGEGATGHNTDGARVSPALLVRKGSAGTLQRANQFADACARQEMFAVFRSYADAPVRC